MDFLNRLQPLALLVMRLVLGAIMIAHGYHKVFGGFHHHMDMVGSLGLPRWLAYFSTGTEFFGGIAIVLGLFTRFFSLAFVIEMGVAIWKVHFKNGLMGNGGYEFPLALAAIAFALMFFGVVRGDLISARAAVQSKQEKGNLGRSSKSCELSREPDSEFRQLLHCPEQVGWPGAGWHSPESADRRRTYRSPRRRFTGASRSWKSWSAMRAAISAPYPQLSESS